MTGSKHVYEVRPRKDHRGVDVISDVLPYGAIRSDSDSLTIEGLKEKSAPPGLPMPRKDRRYVLPLEGEIDLHVSPSVTAALNGMIAKKPKQLVVDLSRVTYIDSAGLAAFIGAMQEVEAYGGKFALAGLQETVRSIFEISRLDQIFQIFPDVDTATDSR